MDSKLALKSILACSASILIILGIILYANMSGKNKEPKDETYESSTRYDAQISEGRNVAPDGNTKAFLNDDTFFDAPDDEILSSGYSDENPGTITLDGTRAAIVATSVCRDLRLQIVDSDGALITGVPFYVTIEEVGQYKDLDQDGVIYIGDLEPGDYSVSIDETEGYLVASSITRVHVKENVDYRLIKDIELIMVHENETDKSADDAPGVTVLTDDADNTEKTSVISGLEKAKNGVMISSNTGTIGFKKLKNAGISYVYVRAGYRGMYSGKIVIDDSFDDNMQGADNLSLKTGVYFESRAVTVIEAVEEASAIITLCREYEINLPIILSMSNERGDSRSDFLSASERAEIALAALETLSNSGYRAGIMATESFMTDDIEMMKLFGYTTCLAQYKAKTDTDRNYQIWNYTANAQVDGISGKATLFLINPDYSDITELRKNSSSAVTDIPPGVTITPDIAYVGLPSPVVTPTLIPTLVP